MNAKVFAVLVTAVGGYLISKLTKERCGDTALQLYFDGLHKDIKLGNLEENARLREKRDLLIQDLRDALPTSLSWRVFTQGSYAMGTGIVPYQGGFDIDIGIAFANIIQGDTDPVDLKQIVMTAIKRGNRNVAIRRPCVTVHYMREGREEYHVDLAVYIEEPINRRLFLASGKRHSSCDLRFWSEQDPEGLTQKIKNRFSGDAAKQFRRCIRFLKAWRNSSFKNGGAPASIALTCAAYHWFRPQLNGLILGTPNDSMALAVLVKAIHEQIGKRPEILLPVAPYSNLLERLTSKQIEALATKLSELHECLETAINLPIEEVENAYEILDSKFQY